MRALKLNRLGPLKHLEIGVLGIDVVHGCQLRCPGCPNSALLSKTAFMDHDVFRTCLENIDAIHVRRLRLFNYGEPLLHPNLPALMTLIPEQKWGIGRTEISTNAQHHDFGSLGEIFRTGLLDALVVSCDGDGTPADYERLRPPGTWEKLLAFLKEARRLRDTHSPGTKLKTRTICETEDGQRRWREVLSPLGWRPHFRQWLAMPEAKEDYSGKPPGTPEGLCYYMKRLNLYVDHDGTVVPCCMHPRAAVIGNLLTAKYSDILRGGARQDFIHHMQTARSKLAICSRCSI